MDEQTDLPEDTDAIIYDDGEKDNEADSGTITDTALYAAVVNGDGIDLHRRLGVSRATARKAVARVEPKLCPSRASFDFPLWLHLWSRGRIGVHSHTTKRRSKKILVSTCRLSQIDCCCDKSTHPKRGEIRLKMERDRVFLTYNQGLTFRLYFLGGMRQARVAKRLRVKVKAVEKTIARINEIFREAEVELPRPLHRADDRQRKLRAALRASLAGITTASKRWYRLMLRRGFQQPNLEYAEARPTYHTKQSRNQKWIEDFDYGSWTTVQW